jgi:hypothetical protein
MNTASRRVDVRVAVPIALGPDLRVRRLRSPSWVHPLPPVLQSATDHRLPMGLVERSLEIPSAVIGLKVHAVACTAIVETPQHTAAKDVNLVPVSMDQLLQHQVQARHHQTRILEFWPP